jgi:hypothetical protein
MTFAAASSPIPDGDLCHEGEGHGPMGLPFLDDHALARERNAALKLASIAHHTALLKTSPQATLQE